MASLVTTTVTGTITVSSDGSFGGANETSATLFVRGGNADFWNSANSLLRINHDGTRANLQCFTGGAYDKIALNPDGGSVGVGTPNPTAKLHVQGDEPQIRVGDNAGTNKFIDIRSNNGNAEFVSRDNAAHGTFKFITEAGTTEVTRMTIINNGNVGMGTDTPYRNAHIYQAADNDQYEGALQVGGNSASVGGYFGYNSTSSGRLTISSLNNSGGANAKIFLGFWFRW